MSTVSDKVIAKVGCINVGIKRSSDSVQIPSYQTDFSSGADLRSTLDVSIQSGKRWLIPTGIYLEIPDGYEVQVRPRSGLAFKHGVTVLNTPGTIDSDYRGELCVLLMNHGEDPFHVKVGDRIAQLVLNKTEKMNFIEKELGSTARGAGGYGSTGVSN